ncbi:hypothetical protein D9M72_249490 [compost metagenome]
MLDASLAIEDQQTVIDAVEHRLQALLLAQQFLHVGFLEHAQGLGHQAEAADQRSHLVHRRQRQGDLEISPPHLVGRLGQGVDGGAEAAGDALGGDETDQQHGNADQSEQPGDQLGAVTGRRFRRPDDGQGMTLQLRQIAAQGFQGAVGLALVQQARAQVGRLAHDIEEDLVGGCNLFELLVGLRVGGRIQAFLQRLHELLLGVLQGRDVYFLAQQIDHLVAQVLAHALAEVEGGEGLVDQPLPGAGDLGHADQPQ